MVFSKNIYLGTSISENHTRGTKRIIWKSSLVFCTSYTIRKIITYQINVVVFNNTLCPHLNFSCRICIITSVVFCCLSTMYKLIYHMKYRVFEVFSLSVLIKQRPRCPTLGFWSVIHIQRKTGSGEKKKVIAVPQSLTVINN